MSRARKPSFSMKHYPLAGGETGYYEFLPTGESRDTISSIATGWFATPRHYFDMAAWMADGGQPTIIPDTTTPLKDEDPENPLAYKLRRLDMAVADSHARHGYGWRALTSNGHSFGGGYQAGLIDDAPLELERMNFLTPAGLGRMDHSLLHKFGSLTLFSAREVLPSLPGLLLHGGVTQGSFTLDLANRRHEERVLHSMTGYLVPFILRAVGADVHCVVYVAPHDHLIDPVETRRIAEPLIGRENVIDIHKHATHLAPNSHGGHVARLILEDLLDSAEEAA